MSKEYKDELFEILVEGFRVRKRTVYKLIREAKENHPNASEDIIFNAVLRTAYDSMR